MAADVFLLFYVICDCAGHALCPAISLHGGETQMFPYV